jgi:GTPase KRas protein
VLKILDTAGADSEYYQHFKDLWINASEAFILVYSVSSRSSFLRIAGIYNDIQRLKNPLTRDAFPLSSTTTSPGQARDIPMILLGNKSDENAKRKVSVQEGYILAREIGCQFTETSAKSCLYVQEAFSNVLGPLRYQNYMQHSKDHREAAEGKRLEVKSYGQDYIREHFGRLTTWTRSWTRSWYSKGNIRKERRYHYRKPLWRKLSRR